MKGPNFMSNPNLHPVIVSAVAALLWLPFVILGMLPTAALLIPAGLGIVAAALAVGYLRSNANGTETK
jgi:hypothetical protein